MNFVKQRLRLYTLKTGFTQLELQKQEIIRLQQYEKAAEIREQQLEYVEKLRELRSEMVTFFDSLGDTKNEIKEKQEILKFLIELNPFDNLFLDPIEKKLEDAKTTYRAQRESDQQQLFNLYQQRRQLLLSRDLKAIVAVKQQITVLHEKLGTKKDQFEE